jgi:hypothetical protein
MASVWSELLPLAVASMLVPVQWTLTILIVRASRLRALAFVLGNVTVRLLQGLLFFLVIPEPSDGESVPGAGVSWLLLIVGVLLLAKVGRSLVKGAPDEDAPPPHWIESAGTMSPGRAYLLGAGLLAIGAKFWVFTMSAVAVLDTADLPTTTAVLSYVAFALLAVLPPLAVIVLTAVLPTRSAGLLDSVSSWLTRHTSTIVVGICLVVGIWFVGMALTELGVL